MGQLTLGSAGKRVLLAALLALAMLFSAAAMAPKAHAARGLELGLYDGEFTNDGGVGTTALDRTVQAHAGWALIYVTWSGVAPASRPAAWSPTDPGDSHYHWDAFDNAVRAASARGLKILLAVTRAPAFAEGPGRPSEDDAPPG